MYNFTVCCIYSITFDLNNAFKKGHGVAVPKELATIIQSRYGKYFTITMQTDPLPVQINPRSFITTVYAESDVPQPKSCCCCCGGNC